MLLLFIHFHIFSTINHVTSHLNNNIIKWNLTPDNIKSQVVEYKDTPLQLSKVLKRKY